MIGFAHGKKTMALPLKIIEPLAAPQLTSAGSLPARRGSPMAGMKCRRLQAVRLFLWGKDEQREKLRRFSMLKRSNNRSSSWKMISWRWKMPRSKSPTVATVATVATPTATRGSPILFPGEKTPRSNTARASMSSKLRKRRSATCSSSLRYV